VEAGLMKNYIVSGSGIDRLIDVFIGTVLSIPFCPLPFCPRTPPGVCMYGNYAKKLAFCWSCNFLLLQMCFCWNCI